jgi:hypothetical protein
MLDVTREAQVERAARALRGWGLGRLAATLLADGGPLAFFGAQALYFAAPVLGALGPGQAVNEWAALLEDPASARALLQALARETGDPPRARGGDERGTTHAE